ncbi:MAG: hypothetical protein HGB00_08405 [Chlorobiaceae bacterium]|nr:hypothetical protein [Chlorobiaceae bacterium]
MNMTELLRKHPLYDANIKTWNYYRDSYEGGTAYEKAALLYQYAYEAASDAGSANKYNTRLEQTPLDNQCKSSLHTYSSYLWRRKPQRDLGHLADNLEALKLLADADLEGTSINEFMRHVELMAHVYGHTWIVMDKSPAQFRTLAQERRAGVRPYMVRYDPPSVWNWEISRSSSGELELNYLKVAEIETDYMGNEKTTIRIWTKEKIEVYTFGPGETNAELEPTLTTANRLGIIPAVCHYSRTKTAQGVGASEIADVAKMQQSIYNDLSEMHQSVRNVNHNTLVKNADDEATSGAGGVIIMADQTDANKKPYLLQSQIFQLEGLINCINKKDDMINRMTHLAPVRNQRNQTFSGEALKTEFQLLNALLNEMAATLQTTEVKLFSILCKWLRKPSAFYSIVIIYPQKFELRDSKSDIELLKEAKALNVQSETYQKEVDKLIASITLEDDAQLEQIQGEIQKASYQVAPSPAPAAAAGAAA